MKGATSAKSFVNWPNVLTASSLAGGFVALILAGRGEVRWAAGTIAVCLVLDVLDGVLARRLSLCGPFGAQLDSLADIVAFGVAPALMLYTSALGSIPVAGLAVCLVYLVCGAWRLARFPLVEHPRRFIGLPIPTAAVFAVGAAVWPLPAGVALAVALVLSALMISEVPFPTHRMIRRAPRPARPVELGEPRLVRSRSRRLRGAEPVIQSRRRA